MTTIEQYQSILEGCRTVFIKKTQDYGTSWRVLRLISIVDQIYIKAWRIRSIQEIGEQKVADSIEDDFRGIVNYAYMALIQIKIKEGGEVAPVELGLKTAVSHYEEQLNVVKELMLKKNHDYGEAWRKMSQESFVDLILTKLLRIKQILNNDGKTLVSEGAASNFCDIANYGIFALIKIKFDED